MVGEKLSAGLEVQYVGSMLTPSGGEAHGHTVSNLTLVAANVAPGLDLTAGVYNLLDTRYGYPASVQHVQDVIPQDGRTLRTSLVWRF